MPARHERPKLQSLRSVGDAVVLGTKIFDVGRDGHGREGVISGLIARSGSMRCMSRALGSALWHRSLQDYHPDVVLVMNPICRPDVQQRLDRMGVKAAVRDGVNDKRQ